MAFNKARLKKIIKEAVHKQLKEEEMKGDPARVAAAMEKSPLLDRMLNTINTKAELKPVLEMLVNMLLDNKGIDANMIFLELEKVQQGLRGGGSAAQEEPAAPANRSDTSLDERSGDRYRREQKVAGMKKDLEDVLKSNPSPEIKKRAEELLKKTDDKFPPSPKAVSKLVQAAYGKDSHLPPQYRD